MLCSASTDAPLVLSASGWMREGTSLAAARAAFIADLELRGQLATARTYRSLLKSVESEEGWRQLVADAVRLKSRSTARTLWAALRSFGTYLVDEGYATRSPLEGVKLPPLGAPPPHRYLSRDELARVYQACRTDRERLIIRLLLHGLRAGQLLAIRPADLRGDVLWIRPQKRNPWHPVTLDAETLRMVEATMPAEAGKVTGEQPSGRSRPPRRSELYVPSANRTAPEARGTRIIPISHRRLGAILDAIGRRAKIKLHPHLLRHTFASHALLNGMDAATLQVAGGWTDQAMIARYTRSARDEAAIGRMRDLGLTSRLLDGL